MPTPTRPRLRRPYLLALVLVTVVGLAVGGVLWRSASASVSARVLLADSGRSDSDIARPSPASLTYAVSDLSIPDARLSVATDVTERHAASERDDTSPDREVIESPRGGSLVLARVEISQLRGSRNSTMANATVQLRAGGRAVSLPLPTSAGGDARESLVQIPGDGSDLEVVVTYAGRTQSVRVADGHRTLGAFAPLYRRDASYYEGRSTTVSSVSTSSPGATVQWDVGGRADHWNAARVPYASAVGWAGPGREWVLIDRLHLRWFRQPAQRSPHPNADFTSTVRTPSVTVNGQPPVHGNPAVPFTPALKGAFYASEPLLFSVPLGEPFEVHLRVPVDLVPQAASRNAARRQTITVERRVRYPAAITPGAAG